MREKGLFIAGAVLFLIFMIPVQARAVTNVPNRPPVVSASSDIDSGPAPLTVNFKGNATDHDGNVTSYGWEFGDRTTSSQLNPVHAYSKPGIYTAVFSATDDKGAVREAALTITVTDSPQNQRPQASLSANKTLGFLPLSVQFIGGGSDPDGSIVSYGWNFGDGAVSSQQSPLHTYETPGAWTATLTVTDDQGTIGTAYLTITVKEPVNQPPKASASADKTSGPAPLTVRFSGSGTDSDGTIASYAWSFGDNTASIEQKTSHQYSQAGTYVATLTVTDDDGAVSTDNLTVSVSLPAGGIPKMIRFQALLQDKQGNPLNGDFKLTFRIYDRETGGTPLWQETRPAVSLEDGVLDVKLGSVNELNLSFDKPYWLGAEVESDGEMSPRFDFTSVPYSYKSAQ
jgi:PKD repeat protein